MATKNLARTVIEGGRTGSYKAEVDDSYGRERTASRAYLRTVERDPEAADEIVAPKRRVAYAEFADKLGPLESFLKSCIGKPWNKVYAMIRERFDIRTTPGRHIVFDHLLSQVSRSNEPFRRFSKYVVDDHGILRKHWERERFRSALPPRVDYKAICNWLGNRKVTRCGERFAWMMPTRDGAGIRAIWGVRSYGLSWSNRITGLAYVYVGSDGKPIIQERMDINVAYRWIPHEPLRTETAATVSYRQGKLFSKDDETFFLKLHPSVQNQILEASATRSTQRW